MYKLCIRREFRARHFLRGEKFGPEAALHEHHYVLEWTLASRTLDADGFIFDLVELESVIGTVLEEFQGSILNDHEFFRHRNPSLEHFCRLVSDTLIATMSPRQGFSRIGFSELRLWEHENAWASWTWEASA